MLRTLILLAILSAFAAVGCGSRPTANPPPRAAATTDTPPSGSASRQTDSVPTTVPAQPQPAATSPPASAKSPVRDFAARLIESDGQGGWRTSEKAATELEKLGAEGIAQLWPLLQDSSADVRRGAAFQLLGQFNPANTDQVAAMSALLGDADRTVRGIGLSAVKQMEPADQAAAVPRLAKMLDPAREEKAANRAAIARLIGSLKQGGAAGLPALIATVTGDSDASVRAASLMAISQVAAPEQAVALLAKGLSDKEPSPRIVAAARLRQLGPAAAPASKELAASLADGEARVAEAAAEALISVGEPAVEALTGQLASENVAARKLALACLAKIGPPAKSAVRAIEKCKEDPDSQVRHLAEAAFRRITGK